MLRMKRQSTPYINIRKLRVQRFDGDALISTNNKVILDNTRDLKAIICEQKSVPKVEVKEALLKKANKCGFGDDIGAITNRVTAMFDVLANLEKDSLEYKELSKRIICGQAYQQEAIDKIKGIEAKKMPKEWFDYKSNKAKDDDGEEILLKKEFNRRIMANKKPYFLIYNYPHLMGRYKNFIKELNLNSKYRFRMSLDELLQQDLSKECDNENDELVRLAKIQYIEGYKNQNPVFTTESTMNKIARHIEEEFKDIKLKVKNSDGFDIEILKSEIKYSKDTYLEIEKLYKSYKKTQKEYLTNNKKDKPCEKREKRITFLENFKQWSYVTCPNSEELCNIVIDMTYKENGNKQFTWDIAGEQIIENLLNKNNRKYSYPVLDKDGDIEWKGHIFKMIEMELNECEE